MTQNPILHFTKKKSLDLNKFKKIGVIRLSAIGDVVLTLPAVSAIKKSFPHLHLTYITEPPINEILECSPYIDKIITLNFRKWKENILKFSTWGEIISSIKELKSEKLDLVINFHILLKAAITAFLASSVRVGIKTKRELNHLFINYGIPQDDLPKHIIEKNLYLTRYLGVKIDEVDFVLKVPAGDKKYVDELLNQFNIKRGEKIIVMAPGASKKEKEWNLKYYAKLIDLINDYFSVKIVLVGSKEQVPMLEKIYSQCSQKPVITGGRTNLKHLVSLLERAILYIGVDTAVMHLAVAKKIPTVVIWPPLNLPHPEVIGPYGDGHTVIRKTMVCVSACPGKEFCRTKECLEIIRPEEVFEVVKSKINVTSFGDKQL